MYATTNDRILIATRKGLFEARKGSNGWSLGEPKMPGKTLAYAVRDPRNGSVWASIDFGHWGCKMARSTDDGQTFAETPPPKYPEATRRRPSTTGSWSRARRRTPRSSGSAPSPVGCSSPRTTARPGI